MSIGERIRSRRRHLGLSMQALADDASVSRGWLGQLERGTGTPSVDITARLARSLQVPVAELVADADESAVVDDDARDIVVVRRENRMALKFPDEQRFWELVTPIRSRLQLLWVELEPHQVSATARQHPGEECIFVVSGVVTVDIDETRYELEAGDTITFSARSTHRILNRGDHVAKLLDATTPPFLQ